MASDQDKASSIVKVILIVLALVIFTVLFASGVMQKFRPILDVSKENEKRNEVIDDLIAQ